METNRTIFESHGYLYKGAAETLEIQISQSGDAARYVSTIMFTVRDPEVTRGRWQEIRYSKRGGRPFITMFSKRLYLDEFVRNNSGF